MLASADNEKNLAVFVGLAKREPAWNDIAVFDQRIAVDLVKSETQISSYDVVCAGVDLVETICF